MLNAKSGWKIETCHRFELEGEQIREKKELMIVYEKDNARKIINKVIDDIPGYNHLPLEYDREVYETEDKLQVYFKQKHGKDELFIEATKVEFVEVGK